MQESSLFTRPEQQDAFDRGIHYLIQQLNQDKIPLKIGQVYKNYENGRSKNRICNYATGLEDEVGYYTDLEMVTILLDVYNNQSTFPFLYTRNLQGNYVPHSELLINIVGTSPQTASSFLGVPIPLADAGSLHKSFHASDPSYGGTPLAGVNVTGGYQNHHQMDQWAGYHEGNWFSNLDNIQTPLSINTPNVIFKDGARWHQSVSIPSGTLNNGINHYGQLVDFLKGSSQNLKFQGFNAFNTKAPYLVGLDPKLTPCQLRQNQIHIDQLAIGNVEERAVIGYTFEYQQAEFIFWILKGEAFLEATHTLANGIRRRVSVSTNGGMGLWEIS